ncbi:MAG: threonine synthase [Deltaproteobacteria bacterium]|nr:threonine synthase [Deltaproteobacteria bacterium]
MDYKLRCTGCKTGYPPDTSFPRCDICGEPLEVETAFPACIREDEPFGSTIFARYGEFLPFSDEGRGLTLGEGFTPLVEAHPLAARFHVGRLFLKDESRNPTWSFKDRGTVTALAHAVALGYGTIGTVSTGNMAASVAAYGARAGLNAVVLVSAGTASEKINPIAIYGARVIRVRGDYGSMYHKSLEIGRSREIYFMNSDVPFRVEGSKTIAFEICEQCRFNVPDFIVVPTSSGGNFRGIVKGFEEFKRAGLIDRLPRFVAAQASGCAPIYKAYRERQEIVTPIDEPRTIAGAIANPAPPSGNAALRKIYETGGIVAAVGDDEIIEAQREMAGQGIFGQPAAAVPLAAVKRLVREGEAHPDHSIVCLVTGGGLKYTAAFAHHRFSVSECDLDDLSRCIDDVL